MMKYTNEELEKFLEKTEESFCMEMNIGKLKDIIKNLPDDMPVFVAC